MTQPTRFPPVADLPQVVLKPRRALPFFNRHPWVFAGAVKADPADLPPGAEVQVVSAEGDFIARGLLNPDTNILVRLYSWEPEVALNAEFWTARLEAAAALRRDIGLLQPETGCRLVFSEADGISGLIIDRYGDWLLVQFTSRALYAHKDILLAEIQRLWNPQGIWLRTEKGMREAEGLEIQDGLLTGEAPPRPLFISENGLRFGVDLVAGQKTGYFLDQRDNRKLAREMLSGPRILDLFCYTGGFAIHVAQSRLVKEVIAVDVSEPALVLGRANAELNGVAERIKFEQGDAFKYIEQAQQSGAQFDSVILDPPKMARHRKSVPDAVRGYERLNRAAMQILKPGGWLLTCSCSGHVDRPMFEAVLAEAATQAGRRVQIVASRGPAADHPTSVHCLENNYLKCYLCRVN